MHYTIPAKIRWPWSALRKLAKGASKLGTRYTSPFLLVVPVVVYAYVLQAVVVSQAVRHEREIVKANLDFVSIRLSRLIHAEATTCRDYAHWDDIYAQTTRPNREWLNTNLSDGLRESFGYDAAALFDKSGNLIWGHGISPASIDDMKSQGVLQSCLSTGDVSGVFLLDGRVLEGAGVAVRKTDHTGAPSGVLFVARLMTRQLLGELSPGTGHRLMLCPPRGGPRQTGEARLPQAIARAVGADGTLRGEITAISDDEMISYAALPLIDRTGQSVGVLVDISSRSSLMCSLSAVKHMSLALMALCVLIGLAGVSYFGNREFARRAHRDELTGLENHAYLHQWLDSQVHIAQRYERPLSVVMLDIDHFKVFNDSYGHAAGDRVLRYVAKAIKDTSRDTDMVARYGGEEFVVVMPETGPAQAREAAERVRAVVEQGFVDYRGAPVGRSHAVELRVTISAGVASFPLDGSTASDLLFSADLALADAKRERNSVSSFSDVEGETCAPVPKSDSLDGFLRDSSISSVRPLVGAIDLRDANMAAHSEKTAEYAVAIGREMGLSTQQLALACKAALLHDVGMIAISDSLLAKTSSLTPEEFDAVKRHVDMGAEMLKQSPQLSSVAEIVRCHHERFDGAGYPNGIKGEHIPLLSRVLTVADVLDALTSPRAYRSALSFEEAGEVLKRESGKQFDPVVVAAAIAYLQRVVGWTKSGDRAA